MASRETAAPAANSTGHVLSYPNPRASCGQHCFSFSSFAEACFRTGHRWYVDASPRNNYAQNGLVSHYQGTINWNTVKANGVQFVYIKATEGTGK